MSAVFLLHSFDFIGVGFLVGSSYRFCGILFVIIFRIFVTRAFMRKFGIVSCQGCCHCRLVVSCVSLFVRIACALVLGRHTFLMLCAVILRMLVGVVGMVVGCWACCGCLCGVVASVDCDESGCRVFLFGVRRCWGCGGCRLLRLKLLLPNTKFPHTNFHIRPTHQISILNFEIRNSVFCLHRVNPIRKVVVGVGKQD